MNVNLSFIKLLVVLLVFTVSSQELDDTGESFFPATQQPLRYLPQPRIVGGQDAQDNQYPYQISLRLFNYHICGGSIISANFILTAAHCVSTGSGRTMRKTPTSYMSIREGSKNVDAGGVVVLVSEIIVHPNYKDTSNDIAVVKLEKSLTFNKSIQQIALAKQRPKVGAQVVTSGWGRLRTSGSSPKILQYNTLEAISNVECILRIGYVPKSILCLSHSAGNGVCSGDSGGPAVFNDELVGVTNFVVGGCGSNAPDGYASVDFFANWIRSVSDVK